MLLSLLKPNLGTSTHQKPCVGQILDTMLCSSNFRWKKIIERIFETVLPLAGVTQLSNFVGSLGALVPISLIARTRKRYFVKGDRFLTVHINSFASTFSLTLYQVSTPYDVIFCMIKCLMVFWFDGVVLHIILAMNKLQLPSISTLLGASGGPET